MTDAVAGRNSQAAMLLAVPSLKSAAPRVCQVAMLVAYTPPSSKKAVTTQAAALIARANEETTVPGTTQVAMLIAYATGVPDQSRTRAWAFTLDGHTFYVLNLGTEGTFVYDRKTKQWAEFSTQGFGQWNFLNGVMWGNRIVGGDSVSSYVWELEPTAFLDEAWRDIAHVVTGGIQTRSRVYKAVDALRIAASIGALDEVDGATLALTYSDDNGKTWSDEFSVTLTEGDYSGEIAFRSLGSFMAPGRIFQLSDSGGLIRIDGADLFADNFDDEQPQGQ